MKLLEVKSSNVQAVGYENNTLYVKYGTGIYLYESVPTNVFIELINADSIGHYLNESIKNKYTYKKLV